MYCGALFMTEDIIEVHHKKLKVVVANDEVVTAYRVTRVKQGERILWQR